MNFEGKIVFISGAITGIDGYRKIFAAAERWLLEQDCTVLNPAVLPPSGLEWEAYLRITTAMVREADAIYVLQNWEHSLARKSSTNHERRSLYEKIYDRRKGKGGSERRWLPISYHLNITLRGVSISKEKVKRRQKKPSCINMMGDAKKCLKIRELLLKIWNWKLRMVN